MINPAPGMAFVVEDTKEKMSESGIILSTDDKLAGVSGIILAINPKMHCPVCSKNYTVKGLKAKDQVLYSKFTAEQIDIELPDCPKGRLRAVPVDSILATLS